MSDAREPAASGRRSEPANTVSDAREPAASGRRSEPANTVSDAREPTEPDLEHDEPAPPVVAVVGRPNVGKSALVNRIIGRRDAVVDDVSGVTRDRVAYDTAWAGRRFTVVDTGGWRTEADATARPPAPDETTSARLARQVTAQARLAAEAADVILLVVDAKVGAVDADEGVVSVLRRSGKPVVLAANKVDNQAGEADAAALWSLGAGEPLPVSALHGRGSGDLLDAVLEALPETPAQRLGDEGGPRRVALLGRPNVGKSSLLNRIAGEGRALVDPVPGTTRDPVDEMVTLGGREWLFVDTAGIRRQAKYDVGVDYYSGLRTTRALDAAEVAIVLLDASQPLAEQDLRILSTVADAGRALVLAFNKWDLLDGERRYYLDKEIDRELVRWRWAPRVNVSALTGRRVDRLVPALDTALEGWGTRVPTGPLNSWLRAEVERTPPPARGGRRPKVLFTTQAGVRPPRFVLFATGFLEAGYRRFLERRLRERFGFAGSPIEVSVRVRKEGKQRQRG